MEAIKLSIVTPYGVIFEGEVQSINLPGVEGEFGVLKGHCDFLSLLKAGVIDIVNKDGKNELIAINWGYAEVAAEGVNIIANGAVAIRGSDSGEIAKSLEGARALLEEAAADKAMLSAALAKMETGARQIL